MTETIASNTKSFNLDKSNWIPICFGDIAIQQKENVDRENTEITRYVKGEHMHSEDLHLREWGELKDEYLGPAFIRKFEPGDILYGSRRTYLKKVVVAPFEGITANTTFVIKANTDIIDSRLLPFIMLSEGFTDHSIKNSKGSVNPYINWKDIANYEFLLPPKDQQAKIAELLWAMDEVVEANINLRKNHKAAYRTIREDSILKSGLSNQIIFNPILKEYVDSKINFIELNDIIKDIRYGTSKKGSIQKKGFPILGIPNVLNERITLDKMNYSLLTTKEFEACKLNYGDILIVRTNGNPNYTGRSAIYINNGKYGFASYLIKISIKKIIDPEYLIRYLQTNSVRRYFHRHATSTAGNYNINTHTIQPLAKIVFL